MVCRLHIPNLRHLRMVQAVGHHGGVNGAARHLHTSQPAVTQALANFETVIGAPLFERSIAGSFPTPLGAQFLQRIDRFFDNLDAALERLLAPEASGRVLRVPQADQIMTNTQMRSFIVACAGERRREMADELDLALTSLLRSARSLERALGVPLFDRTANGPAPNRAGKLLARDFGCAAREIELAFGEALYARGVESLEIVVGVPPMPGCRDLVRAMQAFRADTPDVTLRLVSGDYHSLLTSLGDGAVDMLFGVLRLPGWTSDLREEVLSHDRSCLVARAGHPLARAGRIGSQELARLDWIAPPSNTPRRARLDALLDSAATRPAIRVETTSLTLTRAYLLGSDAVALVPRSEVAQEIELGLLAELPVALPEQLQPKGVTFRQDWLPTAAHRAFLSCLRRSAGCMSPTEEVRHVA